MQGLRALFLDNLISGLLTIQFYLKQVEAIGIRTKIESGFRRGHRMINHHLTCGITENQMTRIVFIKVRQRYFQWSRRWIRTNGNSLFLIRLLLVHRTPQWSL